MILLKSSQEYLFNALQQVAGIVEKRHTMPILSNIFIRKIGNKIDFITSDLEIQLHTVINYKETENDFITTINARKIIDILKTIPSNQAISLNSNKDKIILQSGKSKFSLQTKESIDFPLIQESPDLSEKISIPQKILKKLISEVYYSMAIQDIRYYLNGVLFVIEDEKLILVSTDGHRLAYSEEILKEKFQKREIIIPRKTILELQKILKEDDSIIDIQFSATQAKFSIGEFNFITKLIDGRFPDYNKVIPKNNDIHIKIHRQILLTSLQRVLILTSEKFKAVKVIIENGSFSISSSNIEHEEAFEEIEVDYFDVKIETGFNINYLIDVLSNNNSEFMVFELNKNNGSVLIGVPDHPEFKYVVMPMKM